MTTQKDGTCELQMPSFVVVGAVVCDGKCRCMRWKVPLYACVTSFLSGCRLQSTTLLTPVDRPADSSRQPC